MYRISQELGHVLIRAGVNDDIYREHALRADPTKKASLTSALLLHGYGCFVPDLTSFTAEPCEGARLQIV